MGWGGKRRGAGRKPEPRPDAQARVLAHPSVPEADEEFGPPADMTEAERHVWLAQAPHAFRQRTLTPVTAMAFARYCQMVVQETVMAGSRDVNGANHRGLRREIAQLEHDFLLAPSGKPIAPVRAAEKAPESRLARFRKTAQG